MKRSSLIVLLVLLLSLAAPTVAGIAAAPGSAAPADNPTLSIIDKYRTVIQQEMSKQHIPGMAIAIVDNNQVVWSEGFGYTDFDQKTPVTADTPFSIQSMSKSFTAAGVMLAVQEGLVDLDTPISTYLPGYHLNSIFEARPEDKITLRHLLSHTAGFTHDAPVGNNNDLNGYNWQEHIASIANTWLLYPVGTHYSYANDDIDLAAQIVAVRAGMPFQQYVKTHLLDPLGMTHSSMDVDTIRAMPDRAIGHSAFFQDVPICPIMGAGGVYTTANDLARYLTFYLSLGKVNPGTASETPVLNADLVETMYQGQFPASTAQGYGLGLTFYRSHDATSTLEIEHGGGGFGFLSDMAWFPQLNFGVAWLTNSSDHDLQSWLTGQIIQDYIDANRVTMAMRASGSPLFSQNAFGPQAPAAMTDADLAALIQSKALPDSPEAASRRASYTGVYKIQVWGRTGDLHMVSLANGALTLDGAALTEAQPGLFFTKVGEALDMRGSTPYYKNLPLEIIPTGKVIFYVGFIGLCGLACLALLLWPAARWAWRKIRRRAPGPHPAWQARVAGGFIALAALAGLMVLAILVIYPILLLDGMPWPTPNMPTYQQVLLLSPYLMMAAIVAAALFEGIDWKRKTRREKWIELGKIVILVAYAIVVI